MFLHGDYLNPDILFTHCLLRCQLRASRGYSVKPTEPCHPHVRTPERRSKELPCPRQKDKWTSAIAATGQSLLHVPCPACKSNGNATIRDGSLQKENCSFQCSSPPSDLRLLHILLYTPQGTCRRQKNPVIRKHKTSSEW